MYKKLLLIILASTAFVVLAAGDSIADDTRKKRAQTSMNFLSVSANARATGLGTAVTSDETASAYGMFYNPATMARLNSRFDATGGIVQWIADINYNIAAVAYRPSDGRYGVFGVNLVSVDYGEITETILADNAKGYINIGTFRPNAYSVGFSYARALTNRFSVGANIKYSYQDLGTVTQSVSGSGMERQGYSAGTAAFDFGVHYRTGFESLNFAMSVRNFSPDVRFDMQDYELPLTFRMGISMDIFDLWEIDTSMHSLLLSVDANRPRDFDEQLIAGGEYTFMERFSFRGGYAYPTDEHGISLGFGIRQPVSGIDLHIDYAYTEFGELGDINTFTFRFGF